MSATAKRVSSEKTMASEAKVQKSVLEAVVASVKATLSGTTEMISRKSTAVSKKVFEVVAASEEKLQFEMMTATS